MVKLAIKDTVQLHAEISALLKEDSVNFVTKYDLVNLLDKVESISKNYHETRKMIFEKYGKENDQKILEIQQEDKEGLEELSKLDEKLEKFSESFDVDLFKDVKSNVPYNIIMKFISK